jgi:D-sedoheptulose 7-phosphate isomerase
MGGAILSEMQRSLEKSLTIELEESIQVKQKMLAEKTVVLGQISMVLLGALRAGKKVILFGNGGSAADSQHIAAELVGRFRRERQAMPSVALTTNTSILTAIANDYGYDRVFSRQIEAIGEKGDVTIGISTSGNSPNVLVAFDTAKQMGITTVGFTGEDGGKMKDMVDYCFHAPSSSTARIQEMHITAAHAICEVIEKEMSKGEI